MSDESDALCSFIFIAIVLAMFWVFFSAMEAKTFNQITGSNISTWQAMFTSLRVYAEPSQIKNGEK